MAQKPLDLYIKALFEAGLAQSTELRELSFGDLEKIAAARSGGSPEAARALAYFKNLMRAR